MRDRALSISSVVSSVIRPSRPVKDFAGGPLSAPMPHLWTKIDRAFFEVVYWLEMEARFKQTTSGRRWAVFVSASVCIVAVGVSAHFYELRRAERAKRASAENRLKDLRSQLRLLEDKNRELAEQLREAQRVADELAAEREAILMARAEPLPKIEPGPRPPVPEPAEPPPPEETAPTAPQERDRLRAVVSRMRLERIAVGAEEMRTTAGKAWSTLREALVASARVAVRSTTFFSISS